ncbi:sigma-70 family RNA polymerase sigma factor [Dactylosporangium roseum]|uniref:RNA polymerase sigma factor n=1 Tax=Dactylosporangium roseum TaxID=47989 RepID=A0ABY5Z6Z0_9ACTN|nr:sigma-70 family RNA polymerase sigma factor [Dactylosporangium roseum]
MERVGSGLDPGEHARSGGRRHVGHSVRRNRKRRTGVCLVSVTEQGRWHGVGEELEAREAVRDAYQAHYRRLVAALYALTGDHAEAQDLVQEAYARALARPRQFLDVADPEAWLRTVAMNLARTRWRRRRLFDTLVRSGRVARPVESVPGVDPNRVALVAALQQLSQATRETIVLHHLADMSVHEVADTLGVPVGTVKARLSRGRAMLATLLSDAENVPEAPRRRPVVPEPEPVQQEVRDAP